MVRMHVRIFRGRSRYPGLWLGAGIVVVALVLGWATLLGVPAGSGAPGVRTPPAVGCTVDTVVGSVPPVEAGGVVCLSGTSDRPLTITDGDTVDSPVIYSGGGTATVRGIRVEASNVIVQSFVSRDAAALVQRQLPYRQQHSDRG